MEQTTNELIREFVDQENLNFEMNTDGLKKVLHAIGYKDDFGGVIENFLADNPGAQQAIIDWIGKWGERQTEWKENLESELGTLCLDEEDEEEPSLTENAQEWGPEFR